MSTLTTVAITLPLLVATVAFLVVYRETLRIHKVVNSRLTAALNEIEALRSDLVELRSTPQSRQAAAERASEKG